MKAPVSPAKDGINISLYVQPGASRTGWAGWMGDALKLRIAARPVDGEANKAVCVFVAEFLSVPKTAVSIASGATGRNKTIHVTGPTDKLLEKFQQLIAAQET